MTILNTKDLYQDVFKMHITGGLPKGFDTGWSSLDDYYSVRLGDMAIVTGIPNSGKSEWLDALAVNLSRVHKFKWCIFSPENHPHHLHASKILEKVVGKPFNPGPTASMSQEEMDKGLHWMYKHFDFLDQPAEELSPVSIINELKNWTSEIPEDIPCGVIIDPWNEMDHRRTSGLSETEYISQTLTYFRRYAREANVALYIVAHPMKLQKDKDGNYPCPTPYDISGSAHWRNKADICLTIHRDLMKTPNITQVHVQKVRFKHIGRVGMVEMRWDRATGRYTDKVQSYETAKG